MKRSHMAWVASVFVALGSGCSRQSPPQNPEARRQNIEDAYQKYQKGFAEVPECRVDDVERLQREKQAILVDVRPVEERRISMLPGAIGAEELERNAAQYRGKPLIAYCTVGYRSGLAAQTYAEQGWDAYNLVGGILSWTHAEGALVDAQGQATKNVHVYDKGWNWVAEGYEGVW